MRHRAVGTPTSDGTSGSARETVEDTATTAPPLRPLPGSFEAFELWMNRAGRVGLAALVPLIGVVCALPKVLELQYLAPLCLAPGYYRKGGMVIACDKREVLEDHWSWTELLHYAFSAWVSIQFIYNFAEACFREPGYVEVDSLELKFPVIARSSSGKPEVISYFTPRYCSECRSWKPPRAHHSAKVGRCVLRMDHYCVTVDNVVGVRNHGHFILMVVFGGIGLLYGLIMAMSAIVLAWRPFWEMYERLSQISKHGVFTGSLDVIGMEVMMFLVAVVIATVMLYPLVHNVAVASEGITVLETMLPRQSRDHAILSNNGRKGLFSLGSFSRGSRLANLRALLGRRWLLRLLCPVRGSADLCEETSPVLTDECAARLRKHVEAPGDAPERDDRAEPSIG